MWRDRARSVKTARKPGSALSVRSSLPTSCAAGILAVAVTAVAIGQATPEPSVLQGAYTEEQALRGLALYDEHCAECHGDTMAGLDQAPPLAGPQFSGTWDGEPLEALIERIGKMPPARPGSLTRSENVDILTYMLWYNGLPLGDAPLDGEPGALESMTFQTPLLTNP